MPQYRRGAFQPGNLDEAQRFGSGLYDLFVQLNDPTGQAAVLNSLGILANVRGEMDKAEDLYQKSLDIKQAQGDQLGMARSLHDSGSLGSEPGGFRGAHRLFQAEPGDQAKPARPARPGFKLPRLGEIAQVHGDHDQARQAIPARPELFQAG